MTRFLILAAMVLLVQFTALADLVKSSVLESNVAYLRVGDVGKNLPQEIQSAQKSLSATNQIVGFVLDLRVAGGDDLDSAVAAADTLTQAKLPVAILVNGGTRGAAVKLAEDLRRKRAGLIFGDSTEIKPDIIVTNTIADEQLFLENPYGNPAVGGTNSPAVTNNLLPFVDHTSEADLVRAKVKDGDEDDAVLPERPAEPQIPAIRDPVLARAVDLIKGLAIVRSAKNQNG